MAQCVVAMAIVRREEAARMWQKRETEWEKERVAREKLMAEVRSALCVYNLHM